MIDAQNDVYFEKYLILSLIKPHTETGRPTESESASNLKMLLHINSNLHSLLGVRESLDLLHSMIFPFPSLRRR
jgi:hypothetical protein